MDLLPLSLSGSPSPRYQKKQKTISQKCSRTGSTGYTTEKTKKIELRLFVQRYLTFLFGSCGTHPAPHKKNCRCVRTISRDYGATFIQQEKKNKSTKLDLRSYMRKRPHYLRNWRSVTYFCTFFLCFEDCLSPDRTVLGLLRNTHTQRETHTQRTKLQSSFLRDFLGAKTLDSGWEG